MAHRFYQAPRSCDFLGLVGPTAAVGPTAVCTAAAGVVDGAGAVATDGPTGQGRGFLVWLIDDRDTVVVRSATTLTEAAETARAYCAAWGARVRFIEGPDGEVVDRAAWEPAATAAAPLPYVYTVELRSPRADKGEELVSALWTSTDLAEAIRWRSLLPEGLRSRALVVSNAPDGHYPHSRPTSPHRPTTATR